MTGTGDAPATPRPAAARRPRRWARRLALAALGAVFLAPLSLELAIRAWSGLFDPKAMHYDPLLGWSHAANLEKRFRDKEGHEALVALNAHGNRGPDHGPWGAAATCRVLVLGDSFTEAVQVGEGEVYTALLEAAAPGRQVVNSGVAAYGTVQQYLYLREQGLAHEPDVVLLAFYVNDLTDNCLPFEPGMGPRPWARWESGRLVLDEELDEEPYLEYVLPLPFRSFLTRHSYLYYVLNDRWYARRYGTALAQRYAAAQDRLGHPYRRRVFTGVLAGIAALLEPRGVPLGLVLIPSRDEARRADWQGYAWLESHCASLGLPCLNLHAALHRSYGEGLRPYYDRDIHWTRAGHRVAAAAIEPFLAELCARRP